LVQQVLGGSLPVRPSGRPVTRSSLTPRRMASAPVTPIADLPHCRSPKFPSWPPGSVPA